MMTHRILVFGVLFSVCVVPALANAAENDQPQQSAPTRLDVNDVSWLWPPPEALEATIGIDQLVSVDGAPVWPQKVFEGLLAAVDSDALRVIINGAERRIQMPAPLRKQSTWKLVAFRVDSSAPGNSTVIREHFGSFPQIRLIVQPVTEDDGRLRVHDFAVHLVYSFIQPSAPMSPEPSVAKADRDLFGKIAKDLLALKTELQSRGVSTDGALGVHPGLSKKDLAPQLTKDAVAFLGKYLHSTHLSGMSLMGLPKGPEPWIFVALGPKEGQLMPVPSPALTGEISEMLSFQDSPSVFPLPRTNNRNSANDVFSVAIADRRGVSTAVLFTKDVKAILDAPAAIGVSTDGKPITDSTLLNRDIPDVIADPGVSHFFNTDCVSCHTETTRRFELSLPPSRIAFKRPQGISDLAPAVIPKQKWNLRNFGWFPSNQSAIPTVSRRTANETAEVVDVINREYLGQPP